MKNNQHCKFCEREFNNRQNCHRHEKICKSNPTIERHEETTLLATTENLLREQIDFFKEQLKLKDEELKQKDEYYKNLLVDKDKTIKELLDKKDDTMKDLLDNKDKMIKDLIEKYDNTIKNLIETSTTNCQVIQQPIVKKSLPPKITMPEIPKEIQMSVVENNTVENRIITEPIVFKSKYDRWIKNDCKDALTIKELVELANKTITEKDFEKISLKKYEHKYLYVFKETISKLKKNQLPIQIKNNKPNQEEGYIKTEDGFEKVFRTDLYCKIKEFIKNGLQKILITKRQQFIDTPEFQKMNDEQQPYTIFSILGVEDNDDGKDLQEKKLMTLTKSIVDLCIIPV